jgi:hypothetical protein
MNAIPELVRLTLAARSALDAWNAALADAVSVNGDMLIPEDQANALAGRMDALGESVGDALEGRGADRPLTPRSAALRRSGRRETWPNAQPPRGSADPGDRARPERRP